MISLLLRCYPARWRARYGEELAAILEERPLGPFDVADILLGALDAHLHLRGLGAASLHQWGFTMSLRIGSIAAIISSVLWLILLAGNAINNGAETGMEWLGPVLVGAIVATLIALIGLSAFQARRYPALTWAAFAIPALGAAIALSGAAVTIVNGNSSWAVAGWDGWAISMLGVMLLLVGSGLFAVATLRTRALPQWAALLLLVGAVVVIPGLGGLSGTLVPEPFLPLALLVTIGLFPAGWAALGISALRGDRPATPSLEGASR
jgi:hypothetical protein